MVLTGHDTWLVEMFLPDIPALLSSSGSKANNCSSFAGSADSFPPGMLTARRRKV